MEFVAFGKIFFYFRFSQSLRVEVFHRQAMHVKLNIYFIESMQHWHAYRNLLLNP
jgi:hypothetical protein